MENLGVSVSSHQERIPRPDPSFWAGKRVLVTGHTGFKGAWALLWLTELGADVTGFSLPLESEDGLYARLCDRMPGRSLIGDLMDRNAVKQAVTDADPQIVLHMAAQSLLRRSVAEPVETIATNALGTAHLLDALRDRDRKPTILTVTTDKVYANSDRGEAFCEDAALGGHDPYSASKAAAEHITHSFDMTYFRRAGVPVATARAGNVIGGGDVSKDRLIPDCLRAVDACTPILLRHPEAVRPWQHVLDCLTGYFLFIEHLAQHHAGTAPAAINFGPDAADRLPVGELVPLFFEQLGEQPEIRIEQAEYSVEMKLLMLNPALAERTLGWRCSLSQRDAVRWTANWHRTVRDGDDPIATTMRQIDKFTRLSTN